MPQVAPAGAWGISGDEFACRCSMGAEYVGSSAMPRLFLQAAGMGSEAAEGMLGALGCLVHWDVGVDGAAAASSHP